MNKSTLKTTIEEMNKNELTQVLNEYIEISKITNFKEVLKSKTDYEKILLEKLDEDYENIKKAYIDFMAEKFYKYSAIFELDQKIFSDRFKTFIDKLDNNKSKYEIYNFNCHDDHYNILILEEHKGTKLVGENIKSSQRISGTMISTFSSNDKIYLYISTESIPPQYREKTSTSFYVKKIDNMREWIETELLTNLVALDFEYTIECIRKDVEENDLKVSAQSMNINGGAKATLDSTGSQVIILPILDEIKNLLEDNNDLFKESEKGYNLIKNYIDELEEESELPWVTLSFNKKTQVKFLFELPTRRDYTLLNYYSGDYIKRQGREEMKNVTKSIISRYNTFSSDFSGSA